MTSTQNHVLQQSNPNTPVRVIAFYLPQYHPIPENDEWWGEGFTEWTNVAKARPLFPGHYQPHVPADLGFYDLRVPEVREAQAQMARKYGIEAFCYYHYWFGGKRLLERPFNEVLVSGKPDFPFCLCWANETWTGIWHGDPNRTLIKQTYPGEKDYEQHFQAVLPALKDPRAVKIEGRPVFIVYSPRQLPDPIAFTKQWRTLAEQAGLPGIYLIGLANRVGPDGQPWVPEQNGFDAASVKNMHLAEKSESIELLRRLKVAKRKLLGQPPRLYSYEKAFPHYLLPECEQTNVYPCAIPNWDNSPRSGKRGLIIHNSTPELFQRHWRQVLAQVKHKPAEHKIVFVKSWNEWAEGNHLEPDLKYGRKYLEALRDELLQV